MSITQEHPSLSAPNLSPSQALERTPDRDYWVMRTYHDARAFILEALTRGELRQGWGYAERLNLNVIAAKLENHEWRVSVLDDAERDAWRNQRMWSGHWGRIKVGDVIVVPKLPVDRHWKILEVTGDYYFDISSEFGDYGHVLPVRELVGDVSNTNRRVSAGLQRTMRTPMRLWNITRLGPNVDELISSVREPLARADSDLERLKDVMAETLQAMRAQLAAQFLGNQHEAPVHRLLERLYSSDEVDLRAGPAEQGADFEITQVDPLGVSFTTVVQLKTYQGRIGDQGHGALDQIRQAVKAYSADAAVILTTADGETDEFRQAREKMEEDLNVQVRLVAGEELARLFLANLSDLVDETA